MKLLNTFCGEENKWKIPFGLVWGSQTISIFGSMLVQFALVWWITQTTGSATRLTTAMVFQYLPSIFLGPFIGALVDRWNRKKVMIYADALVALATLGLAALYWAGLMQLWHVYAILFIRSLGGTFQWPAMQASISMMVPPRHLARVSGINQAIRGALNIAAPPLGALLLAWLPMYGVISVDVLTASLAIPLMIFATIPQPSRESSNTSLTFSNLAGDVKEGVRFVLQWKGLRNMIFIAIILNVLSNPAFSLMPILVTDHYSGDVWQFSLMESLFGVGVIIGGSAMGIWGGFKRKINSAVLGLALFGLGTSIIGITPPAGFYIGLVGIFITGLANPVINAAFFAIIQSKVNPDKQGRLFSLIDSLILAFSPVSLLLSGPLAEKYGVPIWFLILGLFTIVAAIGTLFNRDLVQIEEYQNPVHVKTALEPGNSG